MIISFTTGVLLGILFYGGLWITVRRLLVTRHPIAVTLGSMMLRVSLVVAGLWIVTRGQWQNALVCLIGLTIGRVVISRYWIACP